MKLYKSHTDNHLWETDTGPDLCAKFGNFFTLGKADFPPKEEGEDDDDWQFKDHKAAGRLVVVVQVQVQLFKSPFPRQGDVCNSRLVNHIFNTENIDVIFHLAAKTHVGEQHLFSIVLLHSNVRSIRGSRESSNPLFFLSSCSESSFESPSSFQRVNIDGTRVLLGAAHQARHWPQLFVYVSTDEVYGASLDQVSGQ